MPPGAVPDVTGAQGLPVVVDEWQISALGLRRTRHGLGEHKHVVAVPLGENGWQTTVERFLLELPREEILRLLGEAEQS